MAPPRVGDDPFAGRVLLAQADSPPPEGGEDIPEEGAGAERAAPAEGGDHYDAPGGSERGRRPGAPPEPPPPAPPGEEKPVRATPIDPELEAALAQLFGKQQLEAALGRLLGKATTLNLEKFSDFERTVFLVLEVLTDIKETEFAQLAANPVLKGVIEFISKAVIDGDYPVDAKTELMRKLADVHNSAASNPAQKLAVLNVFNNVRKTDKIPAFQAGMSTVRFVSDPENKMLRMYLETYADDHVAKNSPIAQDQETGIAFHESVRDYVGKYPLQMYGLIGKMNAAWFANPPHVYMWKAMMLVAKQQGECEYEVEVAGSAKEKRRISLEDAVRQFFFAAYNSRKEDDRAAIAKWVVQHMSKDMAPLHLELIEYIIRSGTPKIREAVLDGLATLNADNVDEPPLVRAYLKLMEFADSRDRAIDQGTKQHDLHHRLVKYLTDDDGPNLRDPANAFMVDRRPYSSVDAGGAKVKKDPPILSFGIPLLEEGVIEAQRDLAVTQKRPQAIIDQCQATIDALYDERRKHHPLHQGTVGVLIPGKTYMGLFKDDPLERDVHGMQFSYDYVTKELSPSGTRLNIGAFYNHTDLENFIDPKSYEAGLRLGPAWDLSKSLFLKLPFELSFFRIEGQEDDSPKVPFSNITMTGPNSASSVTGYNDIVYQGAGLAFHPQLGLALFRKQLGKGSTFGLTLNAGALLGFNFGAVKDVQCRHAFNPYGNGMTLGPNGQQLDYEVTGGQGSLCRNNEFQFSYSLGFDAGLMAEYQW